jgi:hypothetical protein
MTRYRCLFFETLKLAAIKEYADQAMAETTTQFGLRWGNFDRAEIWADHKKLAAWVKNGERIEATL